MHPKRALHLLTITEKRQRQLAGATRLLDAYPDRDWSRPEAAMETLDDMQVVDAVFRFQGMTELVVRLAEPRGDDEADGGLTLRLEATPLTFSGEGMLAGQKVSVQLRFCDFARRPPEVPGSQPETVMGLSLPATRRWSRWIARLDSERPLLPGLDGSCLLVGGEDRHTPWCRPLGTIERDAPRDVLTISPPPAFDKGVSADA